jgi:hypothetical protein
MLANKLAVFGLIVFSVDLDTNKLVVSKGPDHTAIVKVEDVNYNGKSVDIKELFNKVRDGERVEVTKK